MGYAASFDGGRLVFEPPLTNPAIKAWQAGHGIPTAHWGPHEANEIATSMVRALTNK